MTESEWLTTTDPEPMLEHVRGTASDRKLRLFACICCDSIRSLLTDGRSQRAVIVAERYLDGLADRDELDTARQEARAAIRFVSGLDYTSSFARRLAKFSAEAAANAVGKSARKVASLILRDVLETSSEAVRLEGEYSQRGHLRLLTACTRHCHSIRCVFGNPFRPVAFAESWRTETAIALAAGIYADRAFDRLPILADALEEAGCDSPDVLHHCRDTGPHARGCWVVDEVLGKT